MRLKIKSKIEHKEPPLCFPRKVQYNTDGKIDYYVDYIWADGKIVSQYLTLMVRGTIMNEYKEFAVGPIPSKIIYDDNGIPQGFTCGEATFGFVRNLQGDVIAMVDMNGNIIMEYSYDPWGNIEYHLNEEVTTEEEAMMITALCPLTYRGYNYDFTTGLYYLQSRYYNPEWGRFLNCDDTAILLATQGETHNANLFAYCANNPVNKVDYNGKYSTNLTTSVNAEIYQVMVFFILVYNNPISISVNPTAHKGVINIDLTEICPYMNGEFSDVLLTMYQIYKEQYGKETAENIFYILAVISTYFFYYDFANLYNSQIANNANEEISRREFLFSDECVADEIKAHCEGYWYSIGKIDKTKDSIIMGAGALLVGRDLEEACKCISIAEQDAAAVDDRTVFGYFSGIRACYKNTNADPYWQGEFLGVNIRTYQNVRNEWKEEKISI